MLSCSRLWVWLGNFEQRVQHFDLFLCIGGEEPPANYENSNCIGSIFGWDISAQNFFANLVELVDGTLGLVNTEVWGVGGPM